MVDHMTASLEEFASEVLEDGIIDSDEIAKIRERLYDDGIIDREEADFLFALNDGVSGNDNDPGWTDLFVEAISDHVLKDDESPGVIDEDEASHLIKKIEGDGQVDATELALLVNITANATGESPKKFTNFVLDSVKTAVIADGIVDDDEIDMLRKVIYGLGGTGGSDVDRAEADMLFDMNDATTTNEGHAASWKGFFVEAIAKHVLEDESSPNEIDEEEGDWLISRIEEDGTYDANEKALLTHIKENAKAISGKFKFKIDMFTG